MSPTLTSRFEQALVYATQLHRTQVRKGSGAPYVAHLLAVVALVLEQGGDEDEAIAALLHDGIEDQGGAPVRDEIRRRFGDRVTEIVEGCTDSETRPKPPWKQRKQEHIAQIRGASRSVRLVSAADKLHNVRSAVTDYRRLGDVLWERFRGGKEGTLWYYRALVDAFRSTKGTPLVDELEEAVGELERLADGTNTGGR